MDTVYDLTGKVIGLNYQHGIVDVNAGLYANIEKLHAAIVVLL